MSEQPADTHWGEQNMMHKIIAVEAEEPAMARLATVAGEIAMLAWMGMMVHAAGFSLRWFGRASNPVPPCNAVKYDPAAGFVITGDILSPDEQRRLAS